MAERRRPVRGVLRPSGLVLLAALVAAGCVRRVETRTVVVQGDELRREEPLRSASNLPSAFTVEAAAAPGADCPTRLRDEQVRAVLTLRRSLLLQVPDTAGVAGYRAFGDYAVEPVGAYGDQAGEGLRVDCARLRGLGIVRLERAGTAVLGRPIGSAPGARGAVAAGNDRIPG